MNNAVVRVEGNRAHVAPTWMSRRDVCEHLSITPQALRGLTRSGVVERKFTQDRALFRARQQASEGQPVDLDTVRRERERLDPRPPVFRSIPLTSRKVESAPLPPAPEDVDEDTRRLLRVAKLALRQRDRALMQTRAVEQDRDALQEKLNRVEAAVVRGQDQRERLLRQRDRACIERDRLAGQHERAAEERDVALDHRDALLDRIDLALEQRNYAVAQFQSAVQMLQDWQVWQQEAQETLDRYESRSDRAARLTSEALAAPWWAFSRRKAIEQQIAWLTE